MTVLPRTKAVVAASLLSLVPGCGGAGAEPPGVVIVLVDQLRQDAAERHLARVGALAERGVRVERMRSAAPWTYPSVISLLSGLYPQQHGADGHPHANLLSSFDPELPLLPGVLRDAGYATAAFVANPFLHDFNPLHRSFDHFDASFVGSQGNLRGAGALVWREGMFADSLNRAVLEHFGAGEPASGGEFTYVHYIDVHGPWEGAPWLEGLDPLPAGQELYGLAVEYVDARIVELYEFFLERYDGNLLFVVTSDHGVALGRDELVGAGPPWRQTKASLHEFNLRIPFYVLPSELVPTPRRTSVPCSNVDVLPTLLDWLLDADELSALTGLTGLSGRSLLPDLRGEVPSEPPVQYARMSAFGYRSDCVIRGGRKLIRWQDAEGETLLARRAFDLRADPGELSPLTPGELVPLLDQAAGSHGRSYEASFDEIDPEVLESLRGLGYLGGGD